MEERNYRQALLGQLVTDDFRSAAVFREAGIDYCCGGKKSLEQACLEKQADMNAVIKELQKLESIPSGAAHIFKEWSLDFLADYIVSIHHKYVLKSLPELVFYTDKIKRVHGEHHPELYEVAELFARLSNELQQHLKKEEEVLFPAIKDLLKNNATAAKSVVRSEIESMTTEHEFAGGIMDKINTITGNYELPADGCNTYAVSLRLLQQLEDDLHIHVHLENNILYPGAMKLAVN